MEGRKTIRMQPTTCRPKTRDAGCRMLTCWAGRQVQVPWCPPDRAVARFSCREYRCIAKGILRVGVPELSLLIGHAIKLSCRVWMCDKADGVIAVWRSP